jgi:hypothetical protein
MPGFPRVALNEAELPGVGGKPAVGGRRAEVEFGGVAVQRLAGWRDPLGVGAAGEEDRLLGVGAKGAGDEQLDAVGARGGGHAVEGLGDVGAHALALAHGQWTGVAAAAREPRHAAAGAELGLGDRAQRHAAAGDLDAVLDPHAHADRREGLRVGEAHRRVRCAVGGRDRRGGVLPGGEVGVLGEVRRVRAPVDEHRLEQPEVELVHRPRARERSKVGRPLRLRLPTDAVRDRAEHEHADEHGDQPADQRDENLARFAPPTVRHARHGASVARAPSRNHAQASQHRCRIVTTSTVPDP